MLEVVRVHLCIAASSLPDQRVTQMGRAPRCGCVEVSLIDLHQSSRPELGDVWAYFRQKIRFPARTHATKTLPLLSGMWTLAP